MKIPTESLNSLELLKKLELQENRITSIQEGDFEGKVKNLFSFARIGGLPPPPQISLTKFISKRA